MNHQAAYAAARLARARGPDDDLVWLFGEAAQGNAEGGVAVLIQKVIDPDPEDCLGREILEEGSWRPS